MYALAKICFIGCQGRAAATHSRRRHNASTVTHAGARCPTISCSLCQTTRRRRRKPITPSTTHHSPTVGARAFRSCLFLVEQPPRSMIKCDFCAHFHSCLLCSGRGEVTRRLTVATIAPLIGGPLSMLRHFSECFFAFLRGDSPQTMATARAAIRAHPMLALYARTMS